MSSPHWSMVLIGNIPRNIRIVPNAQVIAVWTDDQYGMVGMSARMELNAKSTLPVRKYMSAVIM